MSLKLGLRNKIRGSRAAGGFVGLLDQPFATGATAAYSLRRLKSTATKAVRVREDSGNTEADIGFSGGTLDTTALLNHVGSNNGFVTKWYDQSGNGFDAIQNTASNQPKIVDSGSVVMENGQPTVDFTGIDAWLEIDTFSDNQPLTYFIVSKLNSNVVGDSNDYTMIDGSGSINFVQIKALGNNNNFILFAGSILSGISENSNQNLHYALFDGSNSVMRTNETENTGDVGGNDLNGLTLGARIDGSGQYWEGNIQEFVLYGEDRSLNKTQIETNINNHYSIF